MKSLVNRVLVVVMVGALTGVIALGKTHKHNVTFQNDVTLSGTLVKKGTYQVKFDDTTNQLSVMKNGKVIAQATAKLEQREKKANDFQLRSTVNGDDTQIVGVTFGGSDKDVIITGAAASTSGTN